MFYFMKSNFIPVFYYTDSWTTISNYLIVKSNNNSSIKFNTMNQKHLWKKKKKKEKENMG